MSIDSIRKSIDRVDEQILDLFLERLALVEKVGDIKGEKNIQIVDKIREREVLDKITHLSGDKASIARILFTTIMDLSKSVQYFGKRITGGFESNINEAIASTPVIFPQKGSVAVQGIEGAYSQQAADKMFSMGTLVYFKSFENVFDAVDQGLCSFGVLPIENSFNGSVKEVYDLMKMKKFHIVRSYKLNISHCLLGIKGTALRDIKEVVSHPQALEQCSSYIKTLGDIKITPLSNTAEAARYVMEKNDNRIVAISSEDCAGLFGLACLEKDVANNANNYTRFICIAKELLIYPGSNKISIMLSTPHKPGGLFQIISRFAAVGVNLTKLESSPIQGQDFEFMFYFDMEGTVLIPEVLSLLAQFNQEIDTFEFLGNYLEV